MKSLSFSEGRGVPTNAPPSCAGEPTEIPGPKGMSKKVAPVPNISLGLPEIPSGARATKSFTYKRNEEKNFTLGMYITSVS